METQGLDTISQCPTPALWCHPTFFGFLPSCLLLFFPLSPLPYFLLPSGWPIPALLLIAATTTCLRQLMCPIAPCTAPSLHSTGDLGKGAEGRREAHREQTWQPGSPRRERHSREISCLPTLSF